MWNRSFQSTVKSSDPGDVGSERGDPEPSQLAVPSASVVSQGRGARRSAREDGASERKPLQTPSGMKTPGRMTSAEGWGQQWRPGTKPTWPEDETKPCLFPAGRAPCASRAAGPGAHRGALTPARGADPAPRPSACRSVIKEDSKGWHFQRYLMWFQSKAQEGF